MLKSILKNRDEKNRLRIEEHIADGMTHLENKFYNDAMIEFDKAMSINPEGVYPKLVDELATAAASGHLESALAIGLNLIKQQPDDYELVNRLGNYAREGKDFKQANFLYKTALKIKPDFELAFYNLAACTAKIDIYDDAVQSAISQFDGIANYILPDYLENPNIIQELSEQIDSEKEDQFQDKLKELSDLRDEEKDAGDPEEAREVEAQINALKEKPRQASSEDILNRLKQMAEENEVEQAPHKINLALFAVRENRPDVALEALKGLTAKDFECLDLLKVLVIEQKGDIEGAISQLNHLLGQNSNNRYNNANLGLMYRKLGKKFLSIKYLIKTAGLLERSNGIYSLRKLREEADQAYDQMQFKKALNFYLVIANEMETAEIWDKIGTIYLERKEYDSAVKAFNRLSKLDPDSGLGEVKLKKIQDYYLEKGETLFGERKFKAAAEYFEKALTIIRSADIIKRTAEVYIQLNNTDREQELLKEHREALEQEKAREQEEIRQQLILKSKHLMKRGLFDKAIEILESAFRLKIDRNIFMQLAVLYKGLKKQDELILLEQKWQKMLACEEKIKKCQAAQGSPQQPAAESAFERI